MSRGVSRQRETKDIFYGDPFKIQSYNFRYAERPVYPVQQYPRPEPQPIHARPQAQFETYYYNHRFKTNANESPWTPVTPASAFTEHRRRKFLHDFKCIPTPPKKFIPPGSTCQRSASVAPKPRRMLGSNPPLTVTNSPLLRSCCHRGEYQMSRRGYQSTTSLVKSSSTNVLRTGAGAVNEANPPRSASTVSLQRKRSGHSGCEININISGLDSDNDTDNNVRIKIETDSLSVRNNTDKLAKPSAVPASRSKSAINFGIDKRLSKFNVAQDRDRNYREQEEQREHIEQRERAIQRERQRELLRELERERDRDRLLQLDAERETDRLRQLEREAQRELEVERINLYQEQQRRQADLGLPMRAVPMPSPVTMTSHLYRPESDDRLPGMMPFCERRTPLQTPTKRAQRLRKLTTKSTFTPAPVPTQAPAPAGHTLERRSSGTSNGNVHVVITTSPSNCSLSHRRRVTEHKPLNSVQHLPIHTRINNMPIRITTSRPADKDPQISINKVRLRNSSPLPVRRPGDDSSSSSLPPYNVNINVYADHLRMMRL